MKFLAENGKVARVRAHQKIVRECYAASLKIPPRYKLRKKVIRRYIYDEIIWIEIM